MNGCWIPDTPIAVDYWRTLNCPAKIFFLSHMHADHTCGLSSSWKDKIYCSELSAKLLKAKFNVKDELIFPLSTGLSHVVELDSLNSVTMTVTLIDAHHCPGAVMFLFEGYFGTVLYTGDFRFCKEMLPDLEVLKGKSIDTLYFDNTYNSPEFQFPSRNVAKEQIKQIINDHQEAVVVFGMFTLGKEDLLVDLAKYFQTYVVVSPEKFEQIKYLDLPDVFTTNIDEGWIHVERRMKITHTNVAKWNKEHETIAILPTAMHTNCQILDRPYLNIYNVGYSDHSSYHELLQFVAHVNPKRLIPIVKNGEKYAKTDITNLHKYDAFLDKTPPTTYVISEVFCSSSINSMSRVVKKNLFSGLKRKHSVGVQFDDSPEKKMKMLEHDDLHRRKEYLRNMEENEMKENKKVVDQSDLLSDDNVEEFAKLPVIKTQAAHNSNYFKKPRPHLIQLFSGHSTVPTYEKLDDSQEKNPLQQNTFHKKNRSSMSCNKTSWSVEPNPTKNCWLDNGRIPCTVSKVSGPDSTKLCHLSTISLTRLKDSHTLPVKVDENITRTKMSPFKDILKTKASCSAFPSSQNYSSAVKIEPSYPKNSGIDKQCGISSHHQQPSTSVVKEQICGMLPITQPKSIQSHQQPSTSVVKEEQICEMLPITQPKSIQSHQQPSTSVVKEEQICGMLPITQPKSIQSHQQPSTSVVKEEQICGMLPITQPKSIQSHQQPSTSVVKEEQICGMLPITQPKSIQSHQQPSTSVVKEEQICGMLPITQPKSIQSHQQPSTSVVKEEQICGMLPITQPKSIQSHQQPSTSVVKEQICGMLPITQPKSIQSHQQPSTSVVKEEQICGMLPITQPKSIQSHQQPSTSVVKEEQICGMLPITQPKSIHSKFEKLRHDASGQSSIPNYETTDFSQKNKSSQLDISHYFKREQSKPSCNKNTQSVKRKLIKDCQLSKTSIPCTVSKIPENISTELCPSSTNLCSSSTETNSSTSSSMTEYGCVSNKIIQSFSSHHQQSSMSVVESCAHFRISRNLQSPVQKNLTISNLIQKPDECTRKIRKKILPSRRLTYEERFHDECIKELIDSLDFSDYNPSD